MSKKFSIGMIMMLAIIVSKNSIAQDLHFSQFFNSPLTTNPANTGFIPDADFRVGGNFRNQWSSIMSVPYKTVSAFADAQLFRDRLESGWFGLGGVFMSDVAGSGSLKSTKIYASFAYHQMLGESSLLSAGFNAGWVSKRIDITKLKFPDQFDGKFFSIAVPTTVSFANRNIDYVDVQTGINYAYFPNDNVYINGGYSLHHINRPKETFFNDPTNRGKLPLRHIGFVNAILKVHDRVILNPNAYYTNQAKASELVFGLNANYNLTEAGEKQLIGGVYYRWNDAIAPMAGIEVGGLRITYSYDASISTLKSFNSGRGANEISIIKKGFYPTSVDRASLCPKF